ncbi:barstar family protein [Nocardia sp. NPDC050406]|uniref:barstar family protein n=1 Tax=Nocardia sp. NPDC050406 TaxID=3364318 RepID=UPI00379A4B91
MAESIRLTRFLTPLTTPQAHLTEMALNMPALGSLAMDAQRFSGLRRSVGHQTRVLRGKKMRTVAALYDEFAAALQFGYYFGENADAFDDCMRDLDDTLGAAEQYVLLVYDAAQLLADEPRQRAWFAEAMADCARYWADEEVIFRVILQGPAPAGLTAARLDPDFG